ncbi:MAG: hypothetical protein V1897_13095 [Pseudomonadota bacterium]
MDFQCGVNKVATDEGLMAMSSFIIESQALLDDELLMLTTFPELIGGLAHEIAQPLNAMSLICEVLRLKVDRLDLSQNDAKFFADKLENMKNQVLRANETVSGVRKYVSLGDVSPPGNMENSLRTIVGLLRQQFISRGIDFVFDIQGEFHSVHLGAILLDLMVAQCLVFGRNRVETLDFKHRQSGLKYSKKIEAFLSTDGESDFLRVRWDQGALEETEWTHGLPATSLFGLQATELLTSKSNGHLEINKGFISLKLQRI